MVTNVQAIGRVEPQELAHRVTSGIEVSLLWRQADNSLTLRLVEVESGLEFEIGVEPENALDAFNHPYAYLLAPKVAPLDLLAA